MSAPAAADAATVAVMVDAAGWSGALDDPEGVIESAVRAAFRGAGRAGDVTVLLTSDAEQQALNARFRGKDAPTNVLAFPSPAGVGAGLGDVSIALETVRREARDQGKPFANHVRHLAVHGTLHLLGFDHIDDDEAAVMEALEREILAELGVPNPY